MIAFRVVETDADPGLKVSTINLCVGSIRELCLSEVWVDPGYFHLVVVELQADARPATGVGAALDLWKGLQFIILIQNQTV